MRRSLIPCRGPVAGTTEDQAQKIKKDQNVDGEQADADPRDAAEDFEDLPGKKRGGNGQSEELAPGLLEVETDAFHQSDRGVAESDETDAFEHRPIDDRSFPEDEDDQPRLGIETQMAGKDVDLVSDVFVEQVVRAHADGKEQQRVEKFIDRDEEQHTVAALRFGANWERESGHGVSRPAIGFKRKRFERFWSEYVAFSTPCVGVFS